MSTIAFQDTFVGASAGALAGRTSTSGHTWENSPFTSQVDPLGIDANATVTQTGAGTNSGATAFVSNWTPPSPNYGIGALVKIYTGSEVQMGVATHAQSDSGVLGAYVWQADTFNGGYTLAKFASSGVTYLATVTHSWSNGEQHYIALYASVSGSSVTLTAYIDGVQAATYTDSSSAFTAAGLVGIRGYCQSSTTTTGAHILQVQTDAQDSTWAGPSSGTVGVASSNFTLTLEVPSILGTTVTPSDSSGGGTFTPTGPTISGGTSSGAGGTSAACTYTAGSSGVKSISATTTNPATNVSGSPISFTATASAATAFSFVGPSGGTVNVVSTNFTLTPNGLYTGTITITPEGGGLSSPIVKTWANSSAAQTFTIDPDATGTVSLTPTNNGSLTNPSALNYVVSAAPTTWSYFSTVQGFATGLVGTVGYTVYAHDGSAYPGPSPNRITEGVAAVGNSSYGALVSLPFSNGYSIEWDDGGSPVTRYACDVVSPSAATPTGLNHSQVLNCILAAVTGEGGILTGNYVDTDGATIRIAFEAGAGQRTSVTLTPPT